MRNRYMFYLIDHLKNRKTQIITFILMIMTCILSCVLASWRAKNYSGELENNRAIVQDYNDNLATYQDEIKTIQEGINTTQKEIDSLQAYMNQSVLMNLDAQHYYVENIQYRLTVPENAGQILNLLQTYIKDGGMKELLTHYIEDFPGEYMDEFISTQIKDVYFDIFVFYGSADGAKQIINEMDTILGAYIQELKQTYGDMQFDTFGRNSYTEASLDITNHQNTRRDNLRTYQAAYADLEQRLINYKTNNTYYTNNNEPVIILKDRPMASFVAENISLGLIALFILLIIVYTIRYIFDDRILDTKYLKTGNVPVFILPDPVEGSSEHPLLQYIKARNQANGFTRFLYREMGDSLLDTCTQNMILSELSSSEKMKGIFLQFVSESNISVAKKIAESDCIIIGLKKKKNTYGDLEKMLQEAKDFAVPVAGIIFQ